MRGVEVVELLVAGVRVEVDPAAGFEVFERHHALLLEGRVEPAMLGVRGSSPGVLHVLLGAGTIALLEPAAPEWVEPDPQDPAPRAEEVFLDFDAHRA